jgi:hypothetical protein
VCTENREVGKWRAAGFRDTHAEKFGGQAQVAEIELLGGEKLQIARNIRSQLTKKDVRRSGKHAHHDGLYLHVEWQGTST